MNENTFINSFFFSFYLLLIVCNRVLAPPLPYLRHPLLHPACPPPPLFFLNLCFPSPLFLFQPHVKLFQTVPSTQATPSSPNPTHQPSIHLINELKQISKGGFTRSTVTFCQKSISNFFKSLYKYVRLS